MKLTIKPLSVNRCWQGKRFKTKEYILYERLIMATLPSDYFIPEGNLQAHYIFGMSNKNADNDNPVKPIQDILQKKYGFNDHRIYKTIVEKIDVPKGEEFIEFIIESFDLWNTNT